MPIHVFREAALVVLVAACATLGYAQSTHQGVETTPLRVNSPASADVEARLLQAWKAAVKRDEQAVVAIIKPLAVAGNAQAQAWLGTLYYHGVGGMPENHAVAIDLFKKGAIQGNGFAQAKLGKMLMNGHGAQQSYPLALEMAERSASTGAPEGKSLLADFYAKGLVVQQDLERSVRLKTEAARGGVPGAQMDLGTAHYFGQGTAVSHSEAMLWWTLSGNSGNSTALSHLEEQHFKITKEQEALVRTRVSIIQRQYWDRPFVYDSLYQRHLMEDWRTTQAKAEQEELARRANDPNERLIARIEAKGPQCFGFANHLRSHLQRAQFTGDWSGFRQTLGRGLEVGC